MIASWLCGRVCLPLCPYCEWFQEQICKSCQWGFPQIPQGLLHPDLGFHGISYPVSFGTVSSRLEALVKQLCVLRIPPIARK
jgi:hypothetical protein